MGYGYYEIGGMKRGYNVACKCHKRGCKKRIDRGLGYLCHGCNWYFCGEHLTVAVDEHDEIVTFDGLFESGSQVCQKCAREFESKTGAWGD